MHEFVRFEAGIMAGPEKEYLVIGADCIARWESLKLSLINI